MKPPRTSALAAAALSVMLSSVMPQARQQIMSRGRALRTANHQHDQQNKLARRAARQSNDEQTQARQKAKWG